MSRTLRTLLVAVLMLAALPWASARAQEPLPEPKVVPIQVTGPASQRLNLIVLGDGYQKDQQSLFWKDVDRNLSVLWATEPFRSYRNYINVYGVELASIDYGVRCDPDGRKRHADGTIRDTGEREGPIDGKNTALRLHYSHSSGSGCTDPLARGVVYSTAPVGCEAAAPYYGGNVARACETGSQARMRILNDYVAPVLGIPRTSQNIQTLAIFNSFTYGGIGGVDATTSGGSPQGPLISLHELGHSLGTLADEYPYFVRDRVDPCNTSTTEPGGNSGFHHTLMTSAEQMIAAQHKWFRWLGEDSLSGGKIGLWEGGQYFPCGVRRPSQHSMMRWLGFDFDQVGLEHMVARISGLRNAGQMNVQNTPAGAVAKDSVIWVETGHPRFHEQKVTWRVGGPAGEVLTAAQDSRNLDLEALNLPAGTVIYAEVRDPVGPDGIDWVRNPSTGNTPPNSGYNGPRFVQTRTWTVGDTTVTPSAPAAEITAHSSTTQPLAADEVAYVETNRPADRVLPVTWTLNGTALPNPKNSRNLDLGALDVPAGTSTLVATVTDGVVSDSVEFKIDKVAPTAARRLSEPLTTLAGGSLEHPVYFGGWDMWLDPKDDTTGYTGTPAVVGQFQLNGDGWFNYFGFPEKQDSPFEFRPSGQVVKALTYGNLGTGGLSTAGFEQTLPDDHPIGGHIPGFGTHTVEHRAIDPAGNYGKVESYKATVLPGSALACGTTLSGAQSAVNVTSGVTCLSGATVSGAVTVASGGSLVVKSSTIGSLTATGADAVHVFGSTVDGAAKVAGSTRDVTIAGSTFKGGLSLIGNTQVTANERYSRLAGAYGPVVAGSTVNGTFECAGNSAAVKDFGAANRITGASNGCAATAVSPELPVGGTVPATLALTLGTAPAFPTFVPGVTREYTTAAQANVISTAGNATLSVSEPGHLSNGAFTLAEPLRVELSKTAWSAPVSNEKVDVTFKQLIKDKDPLRTGTYSKTLTFTLSTTQP
ncbi:peptidase M64 [Solirubrobacter sp. CPCC 204708]|uniref:M64 family metallo-endopeptidase n=1 Tax=Solirubrobacter deserti TaxID=2282478 RepID=A0ABT4RD19_9ACTN|nr:M64 family metallopeptidase [Solirubrobacter deserti]MBE2315640.1 peptidase M64 [Solirubrobacter deserti]MDA0136281.1 M64 family metallo-endopeptidase [Solirubrobacter deserti]